MLNQAPGAAAVGHANQRDQQQFALPETGRCTAAAEKLSATDRENQGKTSPALVDENGEITIEAYMTALLDRVRNKTQGLSPPEMSETVAPKKDVPAEAKLVAIELPGEGEPHSVQNVAMPNHASPPPDSLPLRLPRPRRDPLEYLDMDRLRALAQSHAEASLGRHVRRQSSFAAVRQALIVLVALIVGILLASLSRTTPLAHVPSIMSFAIAIVWALHCAQSMLSLAHHGDRTAESAEATLLAAKRSPLPKGSVVDA